MFLYLPLTCNGSSVSVLHAPEVLENHRSSLLECFSNWTCLMFPLNQAQVLCFWAEMFWESFCALCCTRYQEENDVYLSDFWWLTLIAWLQWCLPGFSYKVTILVFVINKYLIGIFFEINVNVVSHQTFTYWF